MGDGILGHISKGPVHAKIDALVNEKDSKGRFDKRAAFLDAIINQAHTSDDYRRIIMAQARVTEKESTYLADTWYNTGPTGWWSARQPIYPGLRQGLIKALQEAGQDLMLDSYWAPVAGEAVMETIIVKSAVQVTRLIVTPASPWLLTPRSRPAPMWVVKPQMNANEVLGFGAHDEDVESIQGNIVTWRRREL